MTDQFIFPHHSPLTMKCRFSPCFNKPSLDATQHSVLPVPLQISLRGFTVSTPSIHDHFSKDFKHVQVGGLHHRIRHSHWPALDVIHPTEGLVISRPVPLRLYSRTDISLTGFSHQIPPQLFSCPQFIVLRYLISFSMLFTQVNCSENVLWQQFCNSSNLR